MSDFNEAFILLLFLVVLDFGSCYNDEPYYSNCGKVFITVSPVPDTNLELNWVPQCDRLGDIVPDFIILSKEHITDVGPNSPPLLKIPTRQMSNGYYKTKIKFGQPWLPGNWEFNDYLSRADPGPHCFPYWISSVRGDNVIDTQCLAIQPTWMEDNRQVLGSQKIGSLLIPGTHNSGANDGAISLVEGYVLNQDRSIWTQLVFGIRYLDFRIGYYRKAGGFYVNHDQVQIAKVEPMLRQIRKFVELAPYEVVIVDFHRFPFPKNFSRELHKNFTDMVYFHLGHLAMPQPDFRMGNPTLGEIWAQNKNLIICYADRVTVSNSPWLWHPITQYWGDTNKVGTLKRYLSQSIRSRPVNAMQPLWALMAELTPQPIDFILRNNLRKLSENVNKDVTRWVRDEWYNQANIVATDYFLGNDLINVAIEANRRK